MGDGMTHIRNGTFFPGRRWQPTPLEFAEALVNDDVDDAPEEAIALAKAHLEAVAVLRELVAALDERDRAVPQAIMRADDIQSEADRHFEHARRARFAMDKAAHDEHAEKQADASKRATEARALASAERARCEARVERAIEAARKVLG